MSNIEAHCEKCKKKQNIYYLIKDVCEDCIWDILNSDPFPDEPVDYWY